MWREQLSTVTIGNGLKTIGYGAFSYTGLTSIDLVHVETVEDIAFRDCVNLKNVDLGDRLTILKYMAFQGCTSLERISISKFLKTIEQSVFGFDDARDEMIRLEELEQVKREVEKMTEKPKEVTQNMFRAI